MSDDEFRPGSYWSDLIEEFESEEPEAPPDAASLSAEGVSRMFYALRRLHAKIADYDRLHLAELDRLERRRAALVSPIVARIDHIEGVLRQYALRAHLDFGKTGTILATPNGSIRAGRALIPDIHITDRDVAPWLRPLSPDAVFDEPKVGKGALRYFLEQAEERGEYSRAIRTANGKIELLERGEPWLAPLPDGALGVWVKANPDAIGALDVLPGVTWRPAGEQGCGRTFTLVAAA